MQKPALRSHPSRGLTVKGMITGGFCFKAEKEKKPPAERGDLGTFNEEYGSQAVSLQSTPLVSQHVKHSQHDTKYIKV